MRYLMHICFEGSDYCGWQRQPSEKTVQEEIEILTSRLLDKKVTLVGCSRTDSGVHARSFYCHFDVDFLSLKEEKIIFVLNQWLPPSIRLNAICPVKDSFHAQKSTESKTYEYRFALSCHRCVFRHRFVYYLKGSHSNFYLIHDFLPVFIGEHDFTSFCSEPNRYQSRVRRIESLAFYRQSQEWVFRIKGNGFFI